VKVSATVEFSDEQRRLVARFIGQDGLASHIYCEAWVKCQVMSSLAVLAEAERQNTARAQRLAVMGAPLE